jgi:hypothetical protein
MSSPNAWLRPFFARLQAHPAFRQFAPSHQFDQLVHAVELEQPSRAAQMREWTVAAQAECDGRRMAADRSGTHGIETIDIVHVPGAFRWTCWDS